MEKQTLKKIKLCDHFFVATRFPCKLYGGFGSQLILGNVSVS